MLKAVTQPRRCPTSTRPPVSCLPASRDMFDLQCTPVMGSFSVPSSGSEDEDRPMEKDAFEMAIATLHNLDNAISTLRRSALEPLHEYCNRLVHFPSIGDQLNTVQQRLSQKERNCHRETLPNLLDEYRTCVAEVDQQSAILEESNLDAHNAILQALPAIKDRATSVNDAASALLKIATSAPTLKRKRPNDSVEQDPLPATAERCCDFGKSLAGLDSVLDNILGQCEQSYEELLKQRMTPKQATKHRIVQQHKLILSKFPGPLEIAQRRKADCVAQLMQLQGYLKSKGKVDADLYHQLKEEWKDQLKRLEVFEEALRRAAYGVLQANA